MLCDTPTLGINYTDLPSMMPLVKFRFVPKHLYFKDKKIGWEELLKFEGFYERGLSKEISENICYQELSYHELISSLNEFLALIDKPYTDWVNYSKNQNIIKVK